MDKLVSIIIPYYNAGLTIYETLESVFKQGYKNYEIIIVDDCSNDPHSIETINTISNNNQLIVIKNDINRGLPAARNYGVKASKGDYILFLDADDILENDILEKYVNALYNSPPYIGYIYCDYQLFEGKNKYKKCREYNKYLLTLYNIHIVTNLCKKECWLIVQGFDESMRDGLEDREFRINLLKHGFIGKHITALGIKVRVRAESLTYTSTQKNIIKLGYYIRKKHRVLYGFTNTIGLFMVCSYIYMRARLLKFFNYFKRYKQ